MRASQKHLKTNASTLYRKLNTCVCTEQHAAYAYRRRHGICVSYFLPRITMCRGPRGLQTKEQNESRDQPEEEPVVGNGQVGHLVGRQRRVDASVGPQGQPQQGHEERGPVPARDAVHQQPRVACTQRATVALPLSPELFSNWCNSDRVAAAVAILWVALWPNSPRKLRQPLTFCRNNHRRDMPASETRFVATFGKHASRKCIPGITGLRSAPITSPKV